MWSRVDVRRIVTVYIVRMCGGGLIFLVEDVLGEAVHPGLCRKSRSRGSRLRGSLEHACLGGLQETTLRRRSPVNRTDRLASGNVAHCSTNQHLRI